MIYTRRRENPIKRKILSLAHYGRSRRCRSGLTHSLLLNNIEEEKKIERDEASAFFKQEVDGELQIGNPSLTVDGESQIKIPSTTVVPGA